MHSSEPSGRLCCVRLSLILGCFRRAKQRRTTLLLMSRVGGVGNGWPKREEHHVGPHIGPFGPTDGCLIWNSDTNWE